MRPVLRMFFRGLRAVLGPFMLLWERLSRPKAVGREAGEQDEVDRACQQLTLYQFRTCPFCIKVRQECHRLSLRIRRLDAQHDQGVRQQLLHGGGEIKVPCLRIIDEAGNTRWLYESGQIVAYLRGRFPVS